MSDSVEAAIQQAAASATATGTATPIVIKEDRSIVVPTAMQQIAVQCDNEANVLHFVCPRNWADIDLAAATLYINVVKPDKSIVAFVCTNVVSGEDTITFDWVVTEPVTDVVGKLSFLVCARDPSDPGNGYRWHSNLCDSLFVAPGIVCVVPSDTPDPPHIPLYGTDTTLTKPHVPADAAAVGEQLTALSEKVTNLPQADWNQNDSTAADYVKNRPFYTGDPVEAVLVEETTAPFSENNGLYGAEVPSTFEATVGQTYKVSWDGSVYECSCGDLEGELFLGNLSIPGAGSDTGEPFVMVVQNGIGIIIITSDTSASHTFSISKTVVPVVKIDKKYLVQPDWNQNDENAADFVKNRPFYANSLVSVRLPGSSKIFLYKVSDAVPTGEHSVGAPCSIVVEGERTNREIFQSTDDYYAATEGSVVVVLKDNVKIEGITFPKKGTYFAYRSSVSFVSGFALGADADSEITWDGRTEKELKKLDAKYLPDTVATKSEVEAAQTAANSAKTTAEGAHYTANHALSAANSAKTTAEGARTTANNALSAANSAKTTAEGARTAADDAQTTANNALSAANDAKTKVEQALTVDSSGNISAPIHGMNSGTYQSLRLNSADGHHQSLFATSVSAGLRIFVCRDGGLGGPQSNISNPSTVEFVPNGALRVRLKGIDELIMNSATTGSKKKFKITVDDSGALTATEV